MHKLVLSLFLLLLIACPSEALDAAEAEMRRLEQAWHRCLRDAYGHQPAGQSQASDQRNALNECQGREDASWRLSYGRRRITADRWSTRLKSTLADFSGTHGSVAQITR